MPESAVLINVTKCMACRGCQIACKQWNQLPAETTRNTGTYENPPSLSPSTFTRVIFQEVKEEGGVKWLFRKEQCMHCSKAACLELCPSNAIYKNQFGFVGVNNERCIGCGVCEKFCPFKIPHVNRSSQKATKCTLCVDRVANGLQPACVKTCPTGALRFGDRKNLLQYARKVMAGSKKGRMYLYGENELGGLHVLYLLSNRPAVFRLPESPKIPSPFEAYAFLSDALKSSPLKDKVLAMAGLKYFGHVRV